MISLLFLASTAFARSTCGFCFLVNTCVLNDFSLDVSCVPKRATLGKSCSEKPLPGYTAPICDTGLSCTNGVCVNSASPTIASVLQEKLGTSELATALEAHLFMLDEDQDRILSHQELNSADITSTSDTQIQTQLIKDGALFRMLLPFEPNSRAYCSRCAPNFSLNTGSRSSCSYLAPDEQTLIFNNLQCIFKKEITGYISNSPFQKRANLYRRNGVLIAAIGVAGLVSLMASAAALSASESCSATQSCPNNAPNPIRLSLDGGCTGNYNTDSVGFYFNQVLTDLHAKFQNIDTGSETFKAAFPNVPQTGSVAESIQDCFTTIVNIAAKRAININIEKCDRSRIGAAYNPNTGGYMLYGIFDTAKETRLRVNFSGFQDPAAKISYMSRDLYSTTSKLGTILHELTHRYCATKDDSALQYVNNYDRWKRAPAENVAKIADAYRVFYELVMSS